MNYVVSIGEWVKNFWFYKWKDNGEVKIADLETTY